MPKVTLLNYFDESFQGPCGNCDICLVHPELLFDGTVIAQKVLSAVTTSERKIRNRLCYWFFKRFRVWKIRDEHRYLPTFGERKWIHKRTMAGLHKDLLQQGYLKQSNTEFVVLQLTDLAREVLYEGKKVMLHVVHSTKEEYPKKYHANKEQFRTDGSRIVIGVKATATGDCTGWKCSAIHYIQWQYARWIGHLFTFRKITIVGHFRFWTSENTEMENHFLIQLSPIAGKIALKHECRIKFSKSKTFTGKTTGKVTPNVLVLNCISRD